MSTKTRSKRHRFGRGSVQKANGVLHPRGAESWPATLRDGLCGCQFRRRTVRYHVITVNAVLSSVRMEWPYRSEFRESRNGWSEYMVVRSAVQYATEVGALAECLLWLRCPDTVPAKVHQMAELFPEEWPGCPQGGVTVGDTP